MAQIIKTVSVSKEEEEFLTDNNISPTALLRNRVREMMEEQKPNFEIIKNLNRRITALQDLIKKYVNFLEVEGLNDKFIQQELEKWRISGT